MQNLKTDVQALLAALTGGETIISADQNAPRPAMPYWTWRLQSMPSVGDPHYSQGVTTDGDQEVKAVVEATIAVQRFGVDSDIKCAGMRDDLRRMTVIANWQAAELAVFRIGPVQNITQKLDDAKIEARAALDIFVRFGTKLLDRVGYVATVEIDAEYPDTVAEEVIDQIVVTDN